MLLRRPTRLERELRDAARDLLRPRRRCRTAASLTGRLLPRSWPSAWASSGSRRARAAHAIDLRATSRLRALRAAASCAWPRTATATSPRASSVRFEEAVRVACGCQRADPGAAARRASCASRSVRRAGRARAASAGSRAGAARCSVALETAEADRIRRCHPHDPSWQNWPALEHAVIGNIVPDFPLINKSFNLSYAGADL